MITPTHYMLLSAALFIIGVVGVMVRRNIIIIFMSIELILNAVNINLIAFSHALKDISGQIFAIFVISHFRYIRPWGVYSRGVAGCDFGLHCCSSPGC